jgi:hypothetical protein
MTIKTNVLLWVFGWLDLCKAEHFNRRPVFALVSTFGSPHRIFKPRLGYKNSLFPPPYSFASSCFFITFLFFHQHHYE